MTDDRVELKPCAHCGSSDVELQSSIIDTMVRCNDCGCRTGAAYFTNGKDHADRCALKAYAQKRAIAAWNTRAIDPSIESLQAEVERRTTGLRNADLLLTELLDGPSKGEFYGLGKGEPLRAKVDTVRRVIRQALAAKEQTR